jgi:hypothetical protein
MAVVEELKKYPEFSMNDLIAVTEKKLQIGEGTAKQYARMMLRHGLIEFKDNIFLRVKSSEAKEEKKEG